ncbi:MAG: N-acetylmuramoyl-L-alanine amidase [Myxococcales bacterium]|nr:N-acetylmuramoyl-L-alanine amidase [Myxococcales bacterium]MDD9967097.1 N-acetylmuramoyl-L-alanine amidase [Myxococcales bacterium]
MRIIDHRLHVADGQPVHFQRSPNQSSGITPKYLVVHYTAGPSAKRAIATLTNPARKASAHLVIGRDGEITQLVDFNARAWHAGKSSWKNLKGLNRHSIGIELSNPGKLKKSDTGWKTWYGAKVNPELVMEAPHRNGGRVHGWHTYSAEQIEALQDVAAALFETYDLEDLLGHEDIAVGRKSDPGPAFPMAHLRASLLGRGQDEGEDEPYDEADIFVAKTNLNIRSNPSTAGAKLPGSPLTAGTRVAVIGQEGVWRRVDVLDATGEDADLEGWVHGRFLARG